MTWHRKAYIVLLWMIGLHSGVLWGQTPLNFVGMAPCRLADTRNGTGTFGGPSLPPYTERSFPVLSTSCGIPVNAVAYSLNVTVVPAGFLGYLTVWPTGGTQPIASTVNSYLGVAIANAALVMAGTNGAVSVYATNTTDVILDINGYFIGQSTADTQSTALGTGALPSSSTGLFNTGIGLNALGNNSTGEGNVGIGNWALESNTTGSGNTAFGITALQRNIFGQFNTAVGIGTLSRNTIGNNNTAIGNFALAEVTSGTDNIGVGSSAGNSVVEGSYNIEIGNTGTATDSNVIRIGTTGQHSATYIAGIAGVGVTGGSTVLVDPVTNQLGIVVSSERYKEDVHDMDASSEALMRLRPVTFRYKGADRGHSKAVQYGLIAEEVAAIYPGLVVYGRDGEVESIQYHQLSAMLLNEMQKQHQTIQTLEHRITELETSLSNKVQETRIAGK